MWATTGREMQSLADDRLASLCFLDDRDADYEQFRRSLECYGNVGVQGPFATMFDDRQCVAEVASVYAEQFHRMGYLQVDRVCTAAEWAPFEHLRDWVAERDIRRSEVEATFGPPSLVLGKRVLCYAPEDDSGWIFVDCWHETQHHYVPGKGRYD